MLQTGLSRVGVVGYSTRALVESLADFGISAISIDAFGDQDTHDMAGRAYVVDDWPEGIFNCARHVEVDAWLLAGGMENHVSTIESLSHIAPVLGPPADQMQRLRDPSLWQQITCGIDGLAFPATCYGPRDQRQLSAPDTRWLFKPLHGAGGLHVRSIDDYEAAASLDGYLQEFIPGRLLGITWIFHDQTVQLIGATESLSAEQWPGPSPFIYRGSLGPVPLSAVARAALMRMAERVQDQINGYRGWLQADVIEDNHGRLWLLELNPRWTAGMEILHQCAADGTTSPLLRHLQAWGAAANLVHYQGPVSRLAAKAVYYAAAPMSLTRLDYEQLQGLRGWQSQPIPNTSDRVACSIADVPVFDSQGGKSFVAGEPVLSLRVRLFDGQSQP